MSPQHVVALAPGIRVHSSEDGAPHLRRESPAEAEWHVSPLTGVLAALLGDGGVPFDALARVAGEVAGDYGVAEWYVTLPRLLAQGLAELSVTDDAGPLVTLTHLLDTRVIDLAPLDREATYALSRFALLHSEAGECRVTSAASGARLVVRRTVVTALLYHATEGGSIASFTQRLSGAMAEETVDALVTLFVVAGVLVPLVNGAAQERAALHEWELADALLHHRSRLGRHFDPVGSVFPFRGERAPAAAIKSPMSVRTIPLERATGDAPPRSEVPFTTVIEGRRSVRAHGATAITLAQLGAFLFRTARVREPVDVSDEAPYDITSRPYPGGGAAYELEVYVLAGRCDGLERGLYHYAPERHCLEVLDASDADIRAWLTDTRMPAEQWGERQLLVLIAARFRRVTWKYRALAYATVLKDTGVLMQTMSLVATAMELAACPLGAGDGTRLARVIGTDYFEESTVGELTLGVAPRTETGHA